MDLYPKLPDGPSPVGTAQVRAQRGAGGDWQFSQRNSTTKTRVSGEFSRVNIEQLGFLTYGYPKSDIQQGRTVTRYQLPAQPIPAPKTEISDAAPTPGATYFGGILQDYSQFDTFAYTYTFDAEVLGGGTEEQAQEIDYRIMRRHVQIARFNQWGGHKVLADVFPATTLHLYDGFTSADAQLFPVFSPCMAFAGKIPSTVSDAHVNAVFCAYPRFSERVDTAGRPRNDPSVTVVQLGQVAYNFAIASEVFADPDVEFAQYMPCIATENHLAVLMRERFYWTEYSGALDPRDYSRKFWMLRAINKNFSTLEVLDLTALFDGQLSNETFWSTADFYYPAAWFTHIDELAAQHMRTVALPNNVFLLSYFVMKAGTIEGTYQTHHDIRIARIDMSAGVTASITYDEPTVRMGELFDSPSLPSLFWPGLFVSCMVHLGENYVLAKLGHGLQPSAKAYSEADATHLTVTPGEEPLTFIRSTDGGLTWSDITPTGFDADLELGKFGDFTAIEPRKDGEPGVVAVNSWRAETSSYHVYVSKDDGLTWTRQSKIITAETFRRMDGTWRDTRGLVLDGAKDLNTFRHLIPTSGLLDVTIPDRYTDKP